MFLDLQKAMSMRVSFDFTYREKKFIYWRYVFKNVGIMLLVNFKALLLAQFLSSNQISYTKMFVVLLPKW